MSQRLRDYEIVGLGEPEHEAYSSPFLNETLLDDESDAARDDFEPEQAFETVWDHLESPDPWSEALSDDEWFDGESPDDGALDFEDPFDSPQAEHDHFAHEPQDELYLREREVEYFAPEPQYATADPVDFAVGGIDIAEPALDELASGEELEDLVLDEVIFDDETRFEELVPGSAVTFPSGIALPITSGPESTEADEYFDPHRNSTGKGCKLSANPLLDTSAPHRSKKVSANFTVDELTRSGGQKFTKARIDPELVKCLQAIRDRVGKSVTVNSGYRSWGYNRRLYQKRNQKPTRSQHCSGRAADIRISGLSGVQIAKAALAAYGCELGLGIGKNYAHIDIRGCFTVWTYGDVGSTSQRNAAVGEVRKYRGQHCASGGAVASTGSSSPAASVSATSLSRAVVRNRSWAERLGWGRHPTAIGALLGFTNMSPTEQVFAEAVRRWQSANELSADGIIGPNTWNRMKALLGSAASVAAAGAGDVAAGSAAGGAAALGGDRVPAGFKPTRRKGKLAGLSRYGGGRLDAALARLRGSGRLEVTDREIDVFQRIANIETSGMLQGINTWDSAVVSIGFMQFTLQHGKVQEWISRAEAAFRKYGIGLDHGRQYSWGSNRRTAIRGASKDELRWNGWAERFFQAGFDDDAVIAEVGLAREYLARHLSGLKRRLQRLGVGADGYSTFKRHYDASANIRGMFQASFNNLPAASASAVQKALRSAGSGASAATFESQLKAGIRSAFSERGLTSRGEHLTTKTLQGARL